MHRFTLALTAAALALVPLAARSAAVDNGARGLSYVVVVDGKPTHVVNETDARLDDVGRYAGTAGATFVLVARDGTTYRCDDRATVERIDALYAPIRPLAAEERALGAKQRALGDEQRALGHRMRDASDADRAAIGAQQATLGERQAALGEREGAVGSRLGAVGREADRAAQTILATCLAARGCAHPVQPM